MVSDSLRVPREKIADFCRRWKVAEFSFFGSALREDFGPGSDVDVLVAFSADARWGLVDLDRMEEELSSLFGRRVDLVERRTIEQSDNYIRRKHILASTESIYVAG